MDGFSFRQDLSLTTSVSASQMLTQEMQLGLKILAMSAFELEDFLHSQELENPALTREENFYLPPSFDLNAIENKPFTLYEVLKEQAKEELSDDLFIGLEIIGYIDERGFFVGDVDLIAENLGVELKRVLDVLEVVQTFEPFGVGARSVQESLLLQLQFKKNPLSYKIIEKHYVDLLHSRFDVIAKSLAITLVQLKGVIKNEIAVLSPYPGKQYQESTTKFVVPEVVLEREDDKWLISFPNTSVPKVIKHDGKETPFWKECVKRAEWIVKIVSYRKKILLEVLQVLIDRQKAYLSGEESTPKPLLMKEIASWIGVTESTLSRALFDKYLETPIGLISFKSLFGVAIAKGGDISKERAKKLLRELIEGENKRAPDEILVELMKMKGIVVSRRTITKYRLELKIPNSRDRGSVFS